MRGIRGWIKNLADGAGPPPGSVAVSAKPKVDTVELDLTTHKLGAISREHVNGGSGSPILADGSGHFGWNMELNPGPMDIYITPSDPPPTQYRRRFWDESAQIGKAFMTDLERLGHAAGRDCLIWDAVPGGATPASAANWSTDPTNSNAWGQGNGSLILGSTPGKVTVRKFIAFLGGVVFSVEMGDLEIPVAGESVLAANASTSDRWDLICLWMNNDPASSTYGKQRFEFTQGAPGGGIPTFADAGGNTSTIRRLPLHAVKMAAGASVYSDATDLRQWLTPPPGVLPTAIASYPALPIPGTQLLNNTGGIGAALNTILGQQETILPLSTAWAGQVSFNFSYRLGATAASLYMQILTEGRVTTGGAAVAGTDYIVSPLNAAGIAAPRVQGSIPADSLDGGNVTMVFPINRIPAYTSSLISTTSRTWTRLRFSIVFSTTVAGCLIGDQRLAIQLWPVD